MHDIKWIRDNPEKFDMALARRGISSMSAQIIEIDEASRAVTTELQELQNRRNEISKQIGSLKSKGEDADHLISAVADLKVRMSRLEEDKKKRVSAGQRVLQEIPNLPFDDIPDGKDEDDNVEVRAVGKRGDARRRDVVAARDAHAEDREDEHHSQRRSATPTSSP